MAEDETTVLPDLTPTGRIDLAWSAEEFRSYGPVPDFYYPPATTSAPRTRVEVATAIWTLLVIAIMYGCVSDTSYPRVMPASMAVPVVASPSVAAEPTETAEAAQPDAWTLPPIPAAEHLVPPTPAGPVADAKYLSGLQQSGLSITDPSVAIASGHNICGYLSEGYSTEQAAALVMREVPMASYYAYGMVYSSIDAYCPERRR